MPFLIVFGACLIVFGVVYVISTIVTKRSFQGAANWPKAAGKVVRAFVYRQERRTLKETSITFTPVVEYAYTVGEQRYTSEKRDFAPYDCATFTEHRVMWERQPYGFASASIRQLSDGRMILPLENRRVRVRTARRPVSSVPGPTTTTSRPRSSIPGSAWSSSPRSSGASMPRWSPATGKGGPRSATTPGWAAARPGWRRWQWCCRSGG